MKTQSKAFLTEEGADSFAEFAPVNQCAHFSRLQAGAIAKVYAINPETYSSFEDAANSGAIYSHNDKITTGYELDGVLMGAKIATDAIGIPVSLFIRFIR